MMSKFFRAQSRPPATAALVPLGSGIGVSRGGRWRFTTRLAVLVGLLATSVAVIADPASAAVMPSTPTSVTASSVGDTEATLSWSAGGTGDGGTCASDEYYVTIYDATQQSFPAVAESVVLDADDGTSWFVDELSPATRHYVEVEAYGYACDEYSRDLGTAFFTTNASSSGSDPTAPTTRKKRAPLPVRNLQVSFNGSGDLVVTWDKPLDLTANKRKKRCPYTHNVSDDHAALSIEYSLEADQLFSGGATITELITEEADVYLRSADASLTKTIPNSKIPNGTGHNLRVTVTAYSDVCDFWSKSRDITWWK